ncbi:MAG: phosphoadenosine phosphosulfate reductase family protein [Arenicella sp.]
MTINYQEANAALAGKTPIEIVEWVYEQQPNAMVTTNFSPYETVILHMLTQVQADIPVLWIDSGYNKPETYEFAESAIEELGLNVSVYTPLVTAARRDAVMGGIPSINDEGHTEFTKQFKLEPFQRAMKESDAQFWFTAVRREQTALRADMDYIADGPFGVIKVAPLLDWKIADMQAYIEQHNLPNELNYFDPTKAEDDRECGMHTIKVA